MSQLSWSERRCQGRGRSRRCEPCGGCSRWRSTAFQCHTSVSRERQQHRQGGRSSWHYRDGALQGSLRPDNVLVAGANYLCLPHAWRAQLKVSTEQLQALSAFSPLSAGLRVKYLCNSCRTLHICLSDCAWGVSLINRPYHAACVLCRRLCRYRRWQ